MLNSAEYGRILSLVLSSSFPKEEEEAFQILGGDSIITLAVPWLESFKVFARARESSLIKCPCHTYQLPLLHLNARTLLPT